MKNINFLVLKHPRLSFRDSEQQVMSFITERLKHFGYDEVAFISKDDLTQRIKTAAITDTYTCVLDIMNPLIDVDLLNQMVMGIDAAGNKCAISEGAIPGTQIEFLLAPGVGIKPDDSSDDVLRVRWFSQDKYNNQFNLYKYKRLKMFLFLLKHLQDMHTFTVDAFVSKLSENGIFQKLAAFGEEVKVHEYKSCPHCQGRLVALPMTMSQPFCGYLPISRPLYHECEKCLLIVMSPHVSGDETWRLYDAFDKQDFVVTLNNPYHQGTPRCDFSDFIDRLPKLSRTLDLGGGMGGFSKFLKQTYPQWQVTHSDFAIKQNTDLENLGIKTLALNFLKEEIPAGSYDLITAWEVLEHIPYEELDFALNNIHRALAKGGVFMFSTPDFDSPLCQLNDFYAQCPPFHYLVLGSKWIRSYFEGKEKWAIHSMRPCSDFLDDANMWFDYAGKTAPSFQLRAAAKIFKELLTKPENKQLLLDKHMGTEVIVALIKK